MYKAVFPVLGIAFGLLFPFARADASGYIFQTLDNHADPTFNVLTGINDQGVISGYYGNAQAGHTSHGFTLARPYGQRAYHNVSFPGSQQTQVYAINNHGDVLGSYIDGKGNGFDFVRWNGNFQRYDRGPLAGLNDAGITVWTRGLRNAPVGTNAIDLLYRNRHFMQIAEDLELVGTGLNNRNDVVGTAMQLGVTFGWAILDGQMRQFEYKPSESGYYTTELSGINASGTLVGVATSNYGTHGIVITHTRLRYPLYMQLDNPLGESTTLRAINDSGQIVGTFVDYTGNTHGFLATPAPDLLPGL